MSCGWQSWRSGRARAALGLLLWLAAAAAWAQASGALGQAILDRGPLAVHGLPFFPPNALQAYLGEYVVGAAGRDAGGLRVTVYFTREPLVLPAGWRPASCGQEALLRVSGEGEPSFCYVEPGEEGFALFLSFPGESFPWCPWSQAFLQRLRYLLAFSQGSPEIPFPAVFEYGKN
jgi:hypothetical protein